MEIKGDTKEEIRMTIIILLWNGDPVAVTEIIPARQRREGGRIMMV